MTNPDARAVEMAGKRKRLINRPDLEMWFDISINAARHSPFWSAEERKGAETLAKLFCQHYSIKEPRP